MKSIYSLTAILALLSAPAFAGDVTFTIVQDPTTFDFDVFAETSNDDGIAQFAVTLDGFDTLTNLAPTTSFSTAGTSGFNTVRSADNDPILSASQDLITVGADLFFGFGVVGGDLQDGTGGNAATQPVFDAPLLIGSGTASGAVTFIESGVSGAVFDGTDGTFIAPSSFAFQFGFGSGSPILVADPVDGSIISLQGAFDDFSGLLEDAIALSNSEGAFGDLGALTLEITGPDAALFGASLDGENVDLTIDIAAASQLPPDTDVEALLTVSSEFGGSASFTLTATVPEPTSLALIGLGLAGVVSRRRR